MDVVGVRHDLGVSSVRESAVLIRLLTGSRGLRVRGGVFISGKTRSERSRHDIPSDCFLQQVNNELKADMVCPYRTNDRHNRLTGFR